MNYSAQTGIVILDQKNSPSTAANQGVWTDRGIEIDTPKGKVVFRNVSNGKFIQNNKPEDLNVATEEDLTPEEEIRFYKKVFRTSIL